MEQHPNHNHPRNLAFPLRPRSAYLCAFPAVTSSAFDCDFCSAEKTNSTQYDSGGWIETGKAVGLLISLLLVASLADIVLPVYADEAKTIVVPDDYPTIQEAINRADPGDTVYVKAGQYNDSLVIKQSIALIGQKGAVINSWVIDVQPAILVSANNVTVKGITIDNPSASSPWKFKLGIHLLGASNCTISNNVVTNCDREGIWLYQSANNVIEDNTIESSSGISLGLSTNNRINNNTVRNSWLGIYVYYDANNNTFSGNDLYGNDVGISLSRSEGNTFFANKISSDQYGVQIGDYLNEGLRVTNNTFYHNNFINNPKIVEAYPTTRGINTFDKGKEGNYYSDYKGEDADGNGIGDSPFTMVTQGVDITDHYPLMKPWAGDNLPPVITVLSPQNATYTTGELSLNFSVSEPSSQLRYNLDNKTFVISGNVTLTGLANGNHTLVIYALDLAGNEAAPKTVNFTVDVPMVESLPILVIAVCALLVSVLVIALLLWRRKR